MTDTPRTKDELLELFASNPNGDISAQDLRDFVVSASLGGAAGATDQLTAYENWFGPYPYTVDENETVFVDWNLAGFYNPNGWAIADADAEMQSTLPTSSGYNYTSGEMLTLPPGRYVANVAAGINNFADVVSTSAVWAFVDFAYDPTVHGTPSDLMATYPLSGSGAFYGAGGLVKSAYRGMFGRFVSESRFAIDTEFPVALQIGAEDTAAGQQVQFSYVAVTVQRY